LLLTAVEARIVWLDQFGGREDLRSKSKHAPVRIADPFFMVVHVIGSFCADDVWIRDHRTVTMETFFSSALDTG
jgi:hypothetical protein